MDASIETIPVPTARPTEPSIGWRTMSERTAIASAKLKQEIAR